MPPLHNTQEKNIHALSGIRTRDPSNQASTDLSRGRHGHRDRLNLVLHYEIINLPPPPTTNYNPFIQSFNYRLSGKIKIKHYLLKVGLICSLPKSQMCALPFHFPSTICIPIQSLTLKKKIFETSLSAFCLLRTFLLQPISFDHLRAYATFFKITVKTTVIVHLPNLGFQMLQKQAIQPFCFHFNMSLIKMPCLFLRDLLSLLQLTDNGWATDGSRFDSRKRRKILSSPKYPYRL
jgi:hypothetical protein